MMKEKVRELIAISKNGREVWLDHDRTNVTFHVLETPDLLALVREAIETVDIGGDEEIVFEKDMGRVIGTTTLVETTDDDVTVYAKRKQRDRYSRFVKNRQPVSSCYIVVVIRKYDEDYTLWTAMCGRLLPKEAYIPGSVFNATHALVYDENLLQLDTITTSDPRV